jgi:hypothetical protein
MATRTRSGRSSKPPERFVPIENVVDDFNDDEYDSDDPDGVHEFDEDDLIDEEEDDDEDDDEDEGSLKDFIVDEEDDGDEDDDVVDEEEFLDDD